MSWSRLTPLAVLEEHRHHRHACHQRWIKQHVTPRFRQMMAESHVRGLIIEHFEGYGMDRTPACERAAQVCAQYGIDQDHIEDQCGGCRFYVPLEGDLGRDWGVCCTNPESTSEGQLRFEHDGCEAYGSDTEPVTQEYVDHLSRRAELAVQMAREAREAGR
ncbi:MAG TPA: DUF3027 domain-containing protein [bacterium]|nr:DUF3027 domain-containing protein [bacterium]